MIYAFDLISIIYPSHHDAQQNISHCHWGSKVEPSPSPSRSARACGAWGASMSTHCPLPPVPCRQYLPACHGNCGFWWKKKTGANFRFFLHRNEWKLNYWIYELDHWICTFLPLKLETLNFTNKNEMHTFPKQSNKKWQGYSQESRRFTSWTVQNVPFYRLNSGYLQHKERNWNTNHWAQLLYNS